MLVRKYLQFVLSLREGLLRPSNAAAGSGWTGKALADLAVSSALLDSCTLKLILCRGVTGEGGG